MQFQIQRYSRRSKSLSLKISPLLTNTAVNKMFITRCILYQNSPPPLEKLSLFITGYRRFTITENSRGRQLFKTQKHRTLLLKNMRMATFNSAVQKFYPRYRENRRNKRLECAGSEDHGYVFFSGKRVDRPRPDVRWRIILFRHNMFKRKRGEDRPANTKAQWRTRWWTGAEDTIGCDRVSGTDLTGSYKIFESSVVNTHLKCPYINMNV